MSSEENKQDKREPVDIDQMEVGIFIIAKNPDQLKSAAQFLTRRGWPCTCIGNISKAIGTIVEQAPDIVLISVDHPNPNVSRLPILLGQTLNTLCIGFTEDGGALSLNKLNKSKFRHKFNGFPSGPSMHRFIRQTLDSIYNPEEIQTKSKKKAGSADQSDDVIQVNGETSSKTITISGEAKRGSSELTSQEKNQKGKKVKLKDINGGAKNKTINLSAAEMLNKLNQGDDHNPIKRQNNNQSYEQSSPNKLKGTSLEASNSNKKGTSSENENNEGKESDYYKDVLKNAGQLTEAEKLEKKKRIDAKKKSFPWQKNIDPEARAIKNQTNRPGANFEMKQSRDQFQPKSDNAVEPSSAPSKDNGMEIQEGVKNKQGIYIPEAQNKNKQDPVQQEGFKKDSNDPLLSDQKSDEKNKLNEQESADQLKNKMTGEDFENTNTNIKDKSENTIGREQKQKQKVSRERVASSKKLTEEEDKFKESVDRALKETCEEPDPSALIKIENTDQLGVIPVDSQKIHGYFLVGRGGVGFSMGTIFLEILSEAVEKHLALQGIDIHCQKPFLVDTDSFDFEKWAESVNNFTLFEQSAREEIAVTFVPTKDRIPHLVESEKSPDMARINVNHISTEKPVNFNSYIHLEKNSRFYKYLSTGSKLLPRQKEMLQNSKDNSSLHINKSEFNNFKKYAAEILIQELVSKVNSDKKSEDDAA